MKGSVLETYVHNALQFVFPANCFEELLINFNIFHPTCPKMVLSRVLGLGITAGSILLFIPQIIKIFNAKNAKGISLLSQLLALVAAAGTASYSFNKGFVFSQWGDSFFVAIQLMIIVMQILYYSDASAYAFAFFAFCWAFIFAVIGNYVPAEFLTLIQALGIPITVASKTIQAWQNYKDQSTGQLSLVSVSLQFAGTVARVFTSVQDTGDNLLIASFAIAAVLNGILFAQFFLMSAAAPSFLRRVGQKFIGYWKNIGNDYRTVAVETFDACKEKPFKAVFYFSALGGLTYAYHTNPTKEAMLDELREWRQRMTLLPPPIHNKATDDELAERSILLCQNRLHYYNLWFFSLLVRSPHDSSISIYESQDPNLKDWAWNEFFNNILDIGFFGKWYNFQKKLKDYDINEEELACLPS
ncbi:PQ loop repeat protein [Oesophagostomum dentatum]|uniref:Mannose-P-dolichol utilization defect 1 protein homolog n=1 Tax=Oesophagostomum dentatum TaxID=61180 RepID=A0A0B1TMU5_OESDE|nr:PQ loop repeat protein [Oesophagostomum dentatum]